MFRGIYNLLLISIIWTVFNTPALNQSKRPIPYPVYTGKVFNKALQNQTMTSRGLPGEAYWTNFAKYGDPNGRDGGVWTPYTAETPEFMVLDANENEALCTMTDTPEYKGSKFDWFTPPPAPEQEN